MKRSEFIQQAILASMASGRKFAPYDQAALITQARAMADVLPAFTGETFDAEPKAGEAPGIHAAYYEVIEVDRPKFEALLDAIDRLLAPFDGFAIDGEQAPSVPARDLRALKEARGKFK
jgi:hypothetical protein